MSTEVTGETTAISGTDKLLVQREGHVAIVTLNRPDALNSIDTDLHRAIPRTLMALSGDLDVRAIVLTGAGRAFSAGGDLKPMAARFGTPAGRDHAMGVPAHSRSLLQALFEVETPIIAAVNGDAMGLGATVALACDTSVISETAKFGDTHVRVGLVAGDGGAVIWPLLIGANRAKDFLMRGRIISGLEAQQEGICNYAAPVDEVLTRARTIADEIAELPPLAVRWTKASINKGIKAQLNTVFDAGIAYEAMTMMSADHGEAMQAMLEKRKPEFRGC